MLTSFRISRRSTPSLGWRSACLGLLVAALALGVYAADMPPASDAPADEGMSGLPQEPEVIIKQQGHEKIEEYRLNNRLYMIKVTPAKGYPYYLVDTNGDGIFDSRQTDLRSPGWVPQWILLKWK